MTNPYRELAARETAQAADATLANVRDLHVRAAAAWTAMADRADHTARLRLDRESAKLGLKA
jgi:phosphotransferase system HPr-like phosphotransfer protein